MNWVTPLLIHPPTGSVSKVLAGAVYLPWYSDYLEKTGFFRGIVQASKIGAPSIL